MEFIRLIIEVFTAIGTVGAVIVALYINKINGKPKLKIIKVNTKCENKLYFAFQIFNSGCLEPIVSQLGFPNKKKMKWQKLGDSAMQYKKEFLEDDLLDKISYYHYPVKIKSGEMLGILLNRNEILDIRDNLKLGRVKLKLIFIDESKVTIKISKREIDDYLEESNRYEDE